MSAWPPAYIFVGQSLLCAELTARWKAIAAMRRRVLEPILALPAPSWHTDTSTEAYMRLHRLSDLELIAAELQHEQFARSFFGPVTGPTYAPGNAGRHLRHEAWMREVGKIREVEQDILRLMAGRFKTGVEKRRQAAQSAAATRRWRKSRKL